MSHHIINIELDSKQPIYLQIVKYFKVQIHLAQLGEGDEMPSRRVLATQLNINPATVQKAYKQMEEENIIQTMNNSKSVICVDSEVIQKIAKELTENEVRNFLKTVKDINLSFKDVIALLSELWDES